MQTSKGFGSSCIHDPKENRTTKPQSLPIYATSSFAFDNLDQGMAIFRGDEQGHLYGRFGNPTIDSVNTKVAGLETHGLDGITATAMLVSSGMSAISTLLLALLQPGQKILTQGNLYGGTTELFQKVFAPLQIEPLLCNLQDLEQVEKVLKTDDTIGVLYFETPANPTLACIDMESIIPLAHKYGCQVVVDNTFCTPYIQQPFKYGADFIIHSTTKYLNGHGNSISGIIVGQDEELMKGKIFQTMKLAGTNSNAWDAWLLNNGLKTLELRMERHSENAMRLAHFLEQHDKVGRVNYVGLLSHPDHKLAQKQMRRFGGMLSFELKEGLEAGMDFIRKLQFCTLAPTMGDVETLIMHPASMSHSRVPREIRLENDITDGLIRVSTGIENVEDILSDLEQALS